MMAQFTGILIFLPPLLVFIYFIGFLISGKRVIHIFLLRIAEIDSMIILPYLFSIMETENDCCGFSTPFSPEHRLTIIVIIILCLVSYFYSSYRNAMAPPVVEIIVNSFLVIGIILNIFIAIQTNELFLAVAGNVPVVLLGILVLIKNQKIFIEYATAKNFEPKNRFESFAWKVLHFRPIIKYPIILICCLPIAVVIIAILLLVGQKPDSIIRVFTDTYHQGLSQWDYKCNNVDCGGHYLCSVAANGHKKVVKPKRIGIRNGNYIICNRQLLVSNAFEELLEERTPFLHKIIRKEYNKVGNFIHRFYKIFNNKYLSDSIYYLMKPPEWFFLLILYTFDRNPENRISKQYLDVADRKLVENIAK